MKSCRSASTTRWLALIAGMSTVASISAGTIGTARTGPSIAALVNVFAPSTHSSMTHDWPNTRQSMVGHAAHQLTFAGAAGIDTGAARRQVHSASLTFPSFPASLAVFSTERAAGPVPSAADSSRNGPSQSSRSSWPKPVQSVSCDGLPWKCSVTGAAWTAGARTSAAASDAMREIRLMDSGSGATWFAL
jgi:hypothetical protein